MQRYSTSWKAESLFAYNLDKVNPRIKELKLNSRSWYHDMHFAQSTWSEFTRGYYDF